MSVEKVYSCNICRRKHDKSRLIGVVFTTNTKLKLGRSDDTEGAHICDSCLPQIVEQYKRAEREQTND